MFLLIKNLSVFQKQTTSSAQVSVYLKVLLSALILMSFSSVYANTLNQAEPSNAQLAKDIDSMKRQIKNLRADQTHLQSLISDQQKQLAESKLASSQVEETREALVPLMYKMIAGLKDLTQNDMPLKPVQRQARIAQLDKLMARADVDEVEKYKRILEAYQIEMAYGHQISTDEQEITLSSKDKRHVEVLHLGKIALIARSQDHLTHWLWDQKQASWVTLEPHLHEKLELAFGVASENLAPQLIQIPLSVAVQS